MPVVVPLAMAAAEYGGSSLIAGAAADTAFSAALAGTGTFAAANTAATAAAAGMSGLQLAGLGSSLVSSIGQSMQSRAATQSAKYNAAIAANNQVIAKQNATAAMQEGEANASASSQKTKAQLGGILANQGASGVDINSGSSVDVRSSAAQNGELNAINIRADAARRAYGYQTDAAQYGLQEKMDKSEAKNAAISGDINAAGTLLSAAANPSNPFGSYLASQSMGL